jgi:hypothetical protein
VLESMAVAKNTMERIRLPARIATDAPLCCKRPDNSTWGEKQSPTTTLTRAN